MQRKRLSSLREQHEELLGLLAQQELELKIFRTQLLEQCGSSTVSRTDQQVRREAVIRYGAYIDYRQDDALDVDRSDAVQSPVQNLMSGHSSFHVSSPQVL